MISAKPINFRYGHPYQIFDLVRIAIPKIDRFSTDHLMVPCKIMKKIEDKYQVGSKFGIIEICYSASELELLGIAVFPELENIPSNKITIREAARGWMKNVGVDVIVDVHIKTKVKFNFRKEKILFKYENKEQN